MGSHAAVCIGIYDLGTQNTGFKDDNGKEQIKRQVFIEFELADETYLTSNGEYRHKIGNFYTASMNEKAVLRQHLESWRGRPFTEKELEDEEDGFDFKDILGAPVQVMVGKSQTGKPKIKELLALSKGMTKPGPAERELVYFSFDNPEKSNLDGVPEFFQKKLKESPEWAALQNGTANNSKPDPKDARTTFDAPDDDVPF